MAKKENKKKSTFQKLTMIVVWLMLVFTLAAVVLGAVGSSLNF